MPLLRRFVNASSSDIFSTDILSNLPRAALISLWAVGVTEGDSLGVSVGSQIIAAQGTRCNVESATGVIQTNRDQLLFREAVPPGKIVVPVALTTNMDVQLNIKYL